MFDTFDCQLRGPPKSQGRSAVGPTDAFLMQNPLAFDVPQYVSQRNTSPSQTTTEQSADVSCLLSSHWCFTVHVVLFAIHLARLVIPSSV